MKEEYKTEEFKKKLRDRDIKMVCVGERDYPEKLIPYGDKPEVLFYKGRLPDKDKPIVAMVGQEPVQTMDELWQKRLQGSWLTIMSR